MFAVGDLVFAKIKGYRPWPAKIISMDKTTSWIWVMFYGSFERGRVTEQNIWKFDDSSKAKFVNGSKVGQEKFDKALHEIEHDPDIIDTFIGDDIDAALEPPKKKKKVEDVRVILQA